MDVSTCRHIIEDLISSYVDGELEPARAQSLELHMQMCPPCAAFLRTFMASTKAARADVIGAMPQECSTSLWSFLEKELGEELECGCAGKRASSKPPAAKS
ncbi:MAG: anti-sigma factor family protein [Polyangiales bacterium]